jgi:TPR repeat protein
MRKSKLRHLFFIIMVVVFLVAIPHHSQAATKIKHKASNRVEMERLVLMPLRVPEEDMNLTGAMETALVEWLQQKYDVFSGEQVSQKAHQIFLKESQNTAHKECDETRCMQNIAEAFQAELIATANVTKQDGIYFLALSIQNIFDSKVVYSKSSPCEKCSAAQVVNKLKELSGAIALSEESQTKINQNDPDAVLWAEAQKGNTVDDYQVYLDTYPKGKYRPLAKARIKKLKDAAQTASDQLEQQTWEKAQQDNTEGSFGIYLKDYHNGRFAALASVRMNKLQNDRAAKEEQDLWQKVQTSEDLKVPQSYLDKYPNGSHRLAVQEKIAAIQSAMEMDAQLNLADKYYYGSVGFSKDYAKVFEIVSPLANQGNARAQSRLGTLYMFGLGIEKDYVKGMELIQKSADQNNAYGQNALGSMYKSGLGVNKDDHKAFELFQKSATQDNELAQLNLGTMYASGLGVSKDNEAAVEWYQKSANQGEAGAQYRLGYMYANGLGVSKDDKTAVEWYRKAADQGDAAAQHALGYMYASGLGVSKDAETAVIWFRKSAVQGNALAQFNLGIAYASGLGVSKDTEAAVEWYQKSAAQGFASAQLNLGLVYANGLGVKKDDKTAVKWYRKAAEQGDAAAQFGLGNMYASGLGVSKDDESAVEWFRKAAIQGYADAQTNLGGMYAMGLGVSKDDETAVEWYRKAAVQGNALAQNRLGYMYLNGFGVSKNVEMAVEWFRKASAQGYVTAQENLKAIGR